MNVLEHFKISTRNKEFNICLFLGPVSVILIFINTRNKEFKICLFLGVPPGDRDPVNVIGTGKGKREVATDLAVEKENIVNAVETEIDTTRSPQGHTESVTEIGTEKESVNIAVGVVVIDVLAR